MSLVSGVGDALGGLRTIAGSRVLRPVRPDRVARALLSARRFGGTPAAAAAAAAALHPDRIALHDELGSLTFAELDGQVRSLAGALRRDFGIAEGTSIAIMCRNHRGFVQAAVAALRLGARLVPLNTDFAGPQLGDVLAREGVRLIVSDEEFDEVISQSGFAGPKLIAWHEAGVSAPNLAELIAAGAPEAPMPDEPGRIVLLTSGTTGTPKGATRSVSPQAAAGMALGGLLDLARIRPVPRSGGPLLVAPPLFHLFGMLGLTAGLGLGSPIVIRRRFDPEAALSQIAAHRAEALLAVPTMLSRILALPPKIRASHDTSSLRMIVSGAAPLSPELAAGLMDAFGEIVYNGYASTEVGSGTLATPRDLREAPGTVGRPLAGVRIRILDDKGSPVAAGRVGRIFVGSPLAFEGYTGGGSKEVIDGLMSTGDLGHLDGAGRLFVDGRDDDMILSGGENVFPQEVEDLLTGRDDVADAAVLGVPDPDFGQRLVALVVPAAGQRPTEEELREYVREHLARFKVPREVELVDELPRTSTGKLQRRKLTGPDGIRGSASNPSP